MAYLPGPLSAIQTAITTTDEFGVFTNIAKEDDQQLVTLLATRKKLGQARLFKLMLERFFGMSFEKIEARRNAPVVTEGKTRFKKKKSKKKKKAAGDDKGPGTENAGTESSSSEGKAAGSILSESSHVAFTMLVTGKYGDARFDGDDIDRICDEIRSKFAGDARAKLCLLGRHGTQSKTLLLKRKVSADLRLHLPDSDFPIFYYEGETLTQITAFFRVVNETFGLVKLPPA